VPEELDESVVLNTAHGPPGTSHGHTRPEFARAVERISRGQRSRCHVANRSSRRLICLPPARRPGRVIPHADMITPASLPHHPMATVQEVPTRSFRRSNPVPQQVLLQRIIPLRRLSWRGVVKFPPHAAIQVPNPQLQDAHPRRFKSPSAHVHTHVQRRLSWNRALSNSHRNLDNGFGGKPPTLPRLHPASRTVARFFHGRNNRKNIACC